MAAGPSPPGAAVASGFPFLCLMARTCRCRGGRAGPSPLAHPASAPVARGRRSAVPSEFPRAAGHPGTPGRASARIGRRRRLRLLATIAEVVDGRPGRVAARGYRVGTEVALAGRVASQTVGGVACEAGVGHDGTTHPHSRPARATMPGQVPAAGRRQHPARRVSAWPTWAASAGIMASAPAPSLTQFLSLWQANARRRSRTRGPLPRPPCGMPAARGALPGGRHARPVAVVLPSGRDQSGP